MTDQTRRTVRTVVQGIVALCAAAPLLVAATGLPQSAAGVGLFVSVSAAVTRVMAVDAVDQMLPPWLRKTAPQV
jgi:hypothetical protein